MERAEIENEAKHVRYSCTGCGNGYIRGAF